MKIAATGLSATPAAWAVRFTLATWGAGRPNAPALVVSTPTITAAVSGSFTGAWSVPITAAQSAALPAGDWNWELWRTDVRECLAAGVWAVVAAATTNP